MIRNRLKELRHKHMMNQTEFARYLGVLHNQYNIWERQVKQPNLDNVMKLCQTLNIKVEDLIEYIPNN